MECEYCGRYGVPRALVLLLVVCLVFSALSTFATAKSKENTQKKCHNGKDDDKDGLIDCADPDCYNKGVEKGAKACGNTKDDDCDGKVDCADEGCANIKKCKSTTSSSTTTLSTTSSTTASTTTTTVYNGCFDTDGGEDQYTYGMACRITPEGNNILGRETYDYCSSNSLVEASCNLQGVPVNQRTYACPSGCETRTLSILCGNRKAYTKPFGRCKPSATTTTTQEMVCVDSDGDSNLTPGIGCYTVNGQMVENSLVFDSCRSIDGKLIEVICQGNTLGTREITCGRYCTQMNNVEERCGTQELAPINIAYCVN